MTSTTSILLWCSSLLTLSVVYATACERGWYGSLCQYKCHCSHYSCTKCEPGWFGPACQYEEAPTTKTFDSLVGLLSPTEDLVQYGRVTAQGERQDDLITDADDATCVTNVMSLDVVWNVSYPFTWLRITTRHAVQPESFKVVFQDTNNVSATCHHRGDNKRGEMTLDIVCDVNVTVQRLYLTSNEDTDICSLHVSGGRNVALKQKVNQSTVLTNKTDHGPELAVDGRKEDLWKRSQCSHTVEGGDKEPRWEIRLTDPVRVFRYVIYNRHISMTNQPVRPSGRLQRFRLRSYSDNNTLVFDYRDTSSQPQYVYTVTSLTKMAVSRVEITAARNDMHIVLALCEVEIFGETDGSPEIQRASQLHKITCYKHHETRVDYVTGSTSFPIKYVAIGASTAGVLVLLVVMVAAIARRVAASSGSHESVSVDNICVHDLHHGRWDHGTQQGCPSVPPADVPLAYGVIHQPGGHLQPGCGDLQLTYGNIMRYSKTWGSLEDMSSDSSHYVNDVSAPPCGTCQRPLQHHEAPG